MIGRGSEWGVVWLGGVSAGGVAWCGEAGRGGGAAEAQAVRRDSVSGGSGAELRPVQQVLWRGWGSPRGGRSCRWVPGGEGSVRGPADPASSCLKSSPGERIPRSGGIGP